MHWQEKQLDHEAHFGSSSSSRDVARKSNWIHPGLEIEFSGDVARRAMVGWRRLAGREASEDMISEFAGAVENLADHGREGNDLIGELGGQEIHQITSKDFRSVALCSISFISLSSHYNGLVNGDASAAAAAAGEALGEAQFRYKNAVAWLRAALAAIPNSLRVNF
ncbi:hypothetical protein TIFTF001_034970 [Ficus carica]|uniref:Uncharacterized protein n=1 Tax=Ficus carica TaxID=3494 RepID=A0AA88JB74_FICCA|nr:hypothetical protein TIFTF001_034970 [Ficus carica]